jgi:hypothetical protein
MSRLVYFARCPGAHGSYWPLRPEAWLAAVWALTLLVSPLLWPAGDATVVSAQTITDAVTLFPLETVHSNGADLRWSMYAGPSGAPFQKYEIHRSATPNFTPDGWTLLTSIRDPLITWYRDTTAAAGRTFYYKVVANTSPSNELAAVLPPLDEFGRGQAEKRLQPAGDRGAAVSITYLADRINCANYGASETLPLGSTAQSISRALVSFGLKDVPTGSLVKSATVSLYQGSGALATAGTIELHRLSRGWREGSGQGTCTGDGATWYDTEGGVSWSTAGGDFAPTPDAAIAKPGGQTGTWDQFVITTLAQDWIDGRWGNWGMLLKLADESMADGQTITYFADDYAADPALRPLLTMSYVDGSTPIRPSVSMSSPGPGATVKGTAAALTATAGDDRRVDKVEFLLDGALIGTATQNLVPFPGAWTLTWDSTTVANGTHTLAPRATDDAGNVTTAAAETITVQNQPPPMVSITAPKPSATVSGTVTVRASASAASGLAIAKVEFYADGVWFATDTSSQYSVSWNTLDPARPATDGAHVLTAKAYDSDGRTATSAPVSVTVANSTKRQGR